MDAQIPKGKTWLIRTEQYGYSVSGKSTGANKLISVTETKEIRNDSNKVLYSVSVSYDPKKWTDSTTVRNEYNAKGKLIRSVTVKREKTICMSRLNDWGSGGDSAYPCIKTTRSEEIHTDSTEVLKTTEAMGTQTNLFLDSAFFYKPEQPKCRYSFRYGELESRTEYFYTYDSLKRISSQKEIYHAQSGIAMRITDYAYFENNHPFIVCYAQYDEMDTTKPVYKLQSVHDAKGHDLYSLTWKDGKPDCIDTVYYRSNGKFEKRVKRSAQGTVLNTVYFVEQSSPEKQVSYTTYLTGPLHYQVNYYTQNDSIKMQESYMFESPVLLENVTKPTLQKCSYVQFVQIDKASGEILLNETYDFGRLYYRQKKTVLR